ncbi:MAG: SDR family oxidoreductase [Gemmatimonadales bacterium]
MIDPELSGKVVLVTGGNNPHGIGAATASAFAAQSTAVFIQGFRSPQQVSAATDRDGDEPETPGLEFYYSMQARSTEEVVESIRRHGGQADCWEADLGDAAAIPELFDRAERRFGPVDVLVNNAANYQADTFVPGSPSVSGVGGENAAGELWAEGPVPSSMSAHTHDRHFAVNTRAAALMMSEFARRLVVTQKRWGRIINVSADWSWGSPGEVSYRASKHALESYTRSAAAELGPLGVTVNAVSPGPVQTGYIAPEVEESLRASIALRRVGRPEDVADVIVFLASEQARWVTGQVLTVHGGHRMAPGL